jgi:hypothetical protein
MSKIEVEMLQELLKKFWNRFEWPHPMLPVTDYTKIDDRIKQVLETL